MAAASTFGAKPSVLRSMANVTPASMFGVSSLAGKLVGTLDSSPRTFIKPIAQPRSAPRRRVLSDDVL